jgi:tetratricopeptide (TPR) repeat protein
MSYANETVNQYIHLGDANMTLSEYDAALQDYSTALSLTDNDSGFIKEQKVLYYKLGHLMKKKEDNRKAVEFMEQSLSKYISIHTIH